MVKAFLAEDAVQDEVPRFQENSRHHDVPELSTGSWPENIDFC